MRVRRAARPPDVCLVTSATSPTPFGRIAAALAEGFRALGIRFDAIFVRADPSVSRFDGVVRTIGLGVRPRSSVRPLARYLAAARPRLTLVSPTTLAPAAISAGRIARCAVVPWEPTFMEVDVRQPDAPMRARLVPAMQRLTYRWAPGVAAVSSEVRDYVQGVFGLPRHRVFLLPNPVDGPTIVKQAAVEPAPRHDGFTICAAGRLTRQKGFDLLITALHERHNDLPRDWRLLILGDGDWRDRLGRMAVDLGLADRIELLGRLSNPYPAMRNADLFVHPARWEGFGLVLLEALALGIPILATQCPGGPAEILEGGRYGRLIRPSDEKTLGDALVFLAAHADERVRLANLGPQRAQDYSPLRIAERVLEIADQLHHQPAGALPYELPEQAVPQ